LFKRIRFLGRIQDILIALVIGGLIIFGLNIRMERALAELKKYENAKVCQDNPDCRQTIESVIVFSKTAKRTFSLSTSRFSSRTITNLVYVVRYKPENSIAVEVEILPVMSTNVTDFDRPEMFTPVSMFGEEDYFAESSFSIGSSAKVEIWQGKPVVLFSSQIEKFDSVTEQQVFIVSTPPSYNNQNQTQIGSMETDFYKEVAIPTVDNPIIYYEFTKRDYDNSIIAVAFFILILIMLKLKSNLN
jgi:hypothetical protein